MKPPDMPSAPCPSSGVRVSGVRMLRTPDWFNRGEDNAAVDDWRARHFHFKRLKEKPGG